VTEEETPAPGSTAAYERCVVTMVKAFDYSFDQASETCRSSKPADEALERLESQ
jgi:hypothetical protein